MIDPPVDGLRGWSVAATVMLCLVVGPSVLLVGCFGALVEPMAQTFGWSCGTIDVGISLMAASIVVVSPVQGIGMVLVGCVLQEQRRKRLLVRRVARRQHRTLSARTARWGSKTISVKRRQRGWNLHC